MVDIIFGDREKKIFEWCRFRIINDYDIDCELNEPLQYVSNLVEMVCENSRTGHQRQRTRDYKNIALWAVTKKHMGASVIYDLLYSIGNDELKQMITDDMRIPRKLKWTDNVLKKLVLYLLKKMYDDKYCNPVVIHTDLSYTGNDAIRSIHSEVQRILKEHEHEDLLDIIEFFLWILVKDTGYRDQFFWLIDKLGNDELRNMVKDYVKEPIKWAPNAWLASKDTTEDEHVNNRIPKSTLSYGERVNVPSYQKRQLEKIVGAKINR